MSDDRTSKYLFASIVLHVAVLLAFVFSLNFSSSTPVIQNTNKHDVISAVVLGDIPKSKILPQKIVKEMAQPVKKLPEVAKTLPKKIEQPQPPVKQEVIVLKKVEDHKKRDLLAEDLLADIKKQSTKQKKIAKKLQQKKLQAEFEKLLRTQAEKSLRQELLNDEIKLKSSESRQSQGEINKYKALILQVISEQWIVPTQSNKKLYCELIIRLAPGGMVLDVQVKKSSGDLALDNSARAAVLKASPLPVPNTANEFEAFRQFVLKVKPENVMASRDSLI